MRKYLIAVSGGSDSIALLDQIPHRQIKAVVHINYQHRFSSTRDQTIVLKYCHKKHLTIYIKKIPPQIYKTLRANFEDWARKIRYHFFAQVGKWTHTKCILIAHQKDDFLETALMQLKQKQHRLFYGMKEVTYYQKLLIYRPFLKKYTKWELEQYCKNHHLYFGIDETNFDFQYQRNQMRFWLQNNPFKNELWKLVQKINYLNQNYWQIFQMQWKSWKNTGFQLNYLLGFNKFAQLQLLDWFLQTKRCYFNSFDKLNNLYFFLRSTKNQKQFRLKENYFLKKEKNHLWLVKIKK